jgi:RimJ/RimL family protein N-acetyltransferase
MTNSSKHDIYTFSIIKKEDDTLIGNISLVNIYSTHRRAMLAVMIGDVNEQGKGYGTDAITCLLDYAFNQLNLNTIELHVHNFNEKAKKCYEKC